MQMDMHYDGTYALARAAGMASGAAETVATCAQFVDDSTITEPLNLADGGQICPVVTAHHAVNLKNLDARDQRRVWIPFHFLPGNEGADVTEKYICREDSPIAKQMRDHALALHDRPYALALLGITAHVYADTFAHYGFSGVSSRWNRVDNATIVFNNVEQGTRGNLADNIQYFLTNPQKTGSMWLNIKALVVGEGAERFSGALGHASVAEAPDQPYLQWAFTYQRSGARSERDNPASFLRGCRALYDLFAAFVQAEPQYKDTAASRPFEEIKDAVAAILAHESTDADERARAWNDSYRQGALAHAANTDIPRYMGNSWNDFLGIMKEKPSAAFLEHPAYKFFQAAACHRTYVLRDLLPAHGLVVV